MTYDKNEIQKNVLLYRKTKDRKVLDKIARDTQRLAYDIGKGYKQIDVFDINSLYGVALMKCLDRWKENGQASFTTYLVTSIHNEIKMSMRGNQYKFEKSVVNELGEHKLDDLIPSVDNTDITYEILVNDIIDTFTKERVRRALRMYCDNIPVLTIAKETGVSKSMFYSYFNIFKDKLKEELEKCNLDLMKTEHQ